MNKTEWLYCSVCGNKICDWIREAYVDGIAVLKEVWKIIPGHHEPLVTQEVFVLVSAFRPEQFTKRKWPTHPLTGKIYCGGCGYAINYIQQGNSKIQNLFWCGKYSVL